MASEVDGIAVMAHELKSPWTVARQLALSLEMAEGSEVRDQICAQIVQVSERALAQVNDLTKIARLEDGLFNMEPVSVRGICEMVAKDIQPLFIYDQKELQVKYTNHQKVAVANYDLLYSVIYNFCTNAMRYSASDTTSLLSVSDEKNKIRINVRDFGPALPTKIWKTLQQGTLKHPTSIAMRPGSSGLGLYIATHFAEYMHARLGAVRHKNGTSFFVELPVSQQACLF